MEKDELAARTALVLERLKTEEGRRRLLRAMEEARKTTERLEKARQLDPETLREPFTL